MKDKGVLFKNTRDIPNTKDALVQAMIRISEKAGFRCIALDGSQVIACFESWNLCHIHAGAKTTILGCLFLFHTAGGRSIDTCIRGPCAK